MFNAIMFVLIIVFLIWMVTAIVRVWNKGQSQRLSGAEAQAARHGGQYVLEWDGPGASGSPDGEFGPLLVEIPKKIGGDAARFYERGAVIGSKRVSYSNLKDVIFIPGSGQGSTAKQRVRNSAVLWLYRKKGSTIGIRDLTYRFDGETMERIQKGLGFVPGEL